MDESIPIVGVATSRIGEAVALNVSDDENGMSELSVAAVGYDRLGVGEELPLNDLQRHEVRLAVNLGELRMRKRELGLGRHDRLMNWDELA